jgi:hypothetical protein
LPHKADGAPVRGAVVLANPRDDIGGLGKDVLHDGDLGFPLLGVILTDAEGVDPKSARFVLQSQTKQGKVKVLSDVEWATVQLDGSLRIWGPPSVGKTGVFAGLVEGCRLDTEANGMAIAAGLQSEQADLLLVTSQRSVRKGHG